MKLCDKYTRFCIQIGGALLCGYAASLSLALISILSGFSLFRLYSPKRFFLLKARINHSYYPLGSLESIVNPVQPTLAPEDMGAGRFTLNISRVNESVAIDTGIVQASATQTVFDRNPVAILGFREFCSW
ncbi:unnamed protein product [Camellia sinensis]